MKAIFYLLLSILALQFLSGCASTREAPKTPEQRAAAAKKLFDQTTVNYHLPSAQAGDEDKANLLDQAATGYKQLLRRYPDQPFWCAQALRSLGNVRVAQGRLDDAIKIYSRVGQEYPEEDWEILQAWKTAADLLCEAGRSDEGKEFCRKIVERFDAEAAPVVVRTIVRGAKDRLEPTGN